MSINPISTTTLPLSQPVASASTSATTAADSSDISALLASSLLGNSAASTAAAPSLDPLTLLLSLFSSFGSTEPVATGALPTDAGSADSLSLLSNLLFLTMLPGLSGSTDAQANGSGLDMNLLTLMLLFSGLGSGSVQTSSSSVETDFFSQLFGFLGGSVPEPAPTQIVDPPPVVNESQVNLGDIIPVLSQLVELSKDQLIESNKPAPAPSPISNDEDDEEEDCNCDYPTPAPSPAPYYDVPTPKFKRKYEKPADPPPYYAPTPAPYYSPAPYYAPPAYTPAPYVFQYRDPLQDKLDALEAADNAKWAKEFDERIKKQQEEADAFAKSVNPNSPLVFDLNNNQKLTAKGTRRFDIDNDGKCDKISKIDAGDGLLAFDNNQDGKVGKNGGEVFGNNTDLNGDKKADGFANGFEALKGFAKKYLGAQSVADGKLDQAEIKALEAKGLRILVKGKAETLTEQGISEINLNYQEDLKKKDAFGNGLFQQSSFTLKGKKQNVTDVWFLKQK